MVDSVIWLAPKHLVSPNLVGRASHELRRITWTHSVTAVNFTAAANFKHEDQKLIIFDLVDNGLVTHAQPVEVMVPFQLA